MDTMKKKIVISWIAVAFIVGIIFYLTCQDSNTSLKISTQLQNIIVETTNRTETTNLKKWEYNRQYFRRIAHIAEYFLLGFFSYNAWNKTLFQKKAYFRICVTLLECFLVSAIDQIVKGFLPMREFDALDMLYDFGGYSQGIAICFFMIFFVSLFR